MLRWATDWLNHWKSDSICAGNHLAHDKDMLGDLPQSRWWCLGTTGHRHHIHLLVSHPLFDRRGGRLEAPIGIIGLPIGQQQDDR